MSATNWLPEQLRAYLLEVAVREPPVLASLRKETEDLGVGHMHSSPEQVHLIQFLIELTGTKRIIEIGCFTGYGTLGMAMALPNDGQVITLDVNDDWVNLGHSHWAKAGVDGKIEYRSGIALESLTTLLAEGRSSTFDLAYIDADKKTYPDYFELALRLVRTGGLILFDNVFWNGSVAEDDNHERQAKTLRKLTADLAEDPRVSMTIVPIGDGLALARKRT